jgi:hypothetical protein
MQNDLQFDDNTINFYERDFYPLSNFSAFSIQWKGLRFDTSEAVYHWEKFSQPDIKASILKATSAHIAFKLAQDFKAERKPDWDNIKLKIMLDILWAKHSQHEYVRYKLEQTGERNLVEGSWRDDYWGVGPNKDGRNQLGKLWMLIRSQHRTILGLAREYDLAMGVDVEKLNELDT